jgi:hypothetical protein
MSELISLAEAMRREERMRSAKGNGPKSNGQAKPAIVSPPAPTDDEAIVWQTAAALQQKSFAPIRWAVPEIFVEGLTLLAGKPKRGKSWFALNCAIAVASGGTALGSLQCEERDVLALMLEDNERRIQDRLRQLEPSMRWPERLAYATEWPRLDEGGLERMDRWRRSMKNPGLIIVDVLEKVRGLARRNSAYADDYGALSGLHEFSSKHRIPIAVIVHCRKANSDDDVFDEISCTTGLTGAADSALVLKHGTDAARADFLCGRGRDLPEFEKAILFDKTRGLWTLLGEASDYRGSETARKITDVLSDMSEGMSLAEIHAAVGGDYQSLKQRLYRMSLSGEVRKLDRGKYAAT